LAIAKGKIIFIRQPNTGAPDGKGILKYWDIEKKDEKTILDGVDNARLSANGQKLLVAKSGTFAVITPNENKKFEKTLPLGDMQMVVDPVQEWKQIFMDVWRLNGIIFMMRGCMGLIGNRQRNVILKMLDGAMTREEADYVIGELIGELNASHTYHGGGDMEVAKNKSVGYLGVDWQADGDNYKIKKIIRGAGMGCRGPVFARSAGCCNQRR
jgi:tricorn protease